MVLLKKKNGVPDSIDREVINMVLGNTRYKFFTVVVLQILASYEMSTVKQRHFEGS
jgi:hypothetical protein